MPGTDMNERVSTGVDGLDAILGGGLHRAGIYIITGRPGAGKTILSNQVVYTHAAKGGRAVYTTLLAETHERMFAQLRTMSFFEHEKVGRDVVYLNGLSAMLDGGLTKLLALLRSMVREHKASLLVIDGLVTAATLSTPLDFKRFISELQSSASSRRGCRSWVALSCS
jgi:circadian clock protein KaiC